MWLPGSHRLHRVLGCDVGGRHRFECCGYERRYSATFFNGSDQDCNGRLGLRISLLPFHRGIVGVTSGDSIHLQSCYGFDSKWL